MSDTPNPAFGDWDPDDSFDHEPPDPLQVAIKLQMLRRAADLSRRVDNHDWDDLDADDREKLIEIIARLLGWLRRQGAIR